MYFITISNGLLSPAHRERMGVAIWEFLWCIDRMTRLDENGVGIVRGGAPTKLVEIAGALGCSESTVSRNLRRLSESGYIRLTYAPYGIVIRVPKAKKRFGLRVTTQPINRLRKSAETHGKSDRSPYVPVELQKVGKETGIEHKSVEASSNGDNQRFQALKADINKLAQTFRCTK